MLAASAACTGEDTPVTQPPDSGSGGGHGGGVAAGSGGGAGGGSGGGSASTAECDGFAAKDSSGNSFNVETFAYGGSLTAEGCAATIAAYTDGTSLASAAGVYDFDTNSVAEPARPRRPCTSATALISGCPDSLPEARPSPRPPER